MGYFRKVREAQHRKQKVVHGAESSRGAGYSQCLKKQPYSSLRHAERIVARIQVERNTTLRVYLCPLCQMYHLTKKEDRHHAINTDKSARYN
jgi:hypothetical protein